MSAGPEHDHVGKPPLAGLRVLELAGLGAAPFGVTMLTDLGADVTRVGRPGSDEGGMRDLTRSFNRGRRSLTVDLRHPDGLEVVLTLAEGSDVLVESFRPGVVERLGVGPSVVCGRNPRLIYARLTGWGPVGPLAVRAGHDLNYTGLSGALHPLGDRDRPPPPPLGYASENAGGGMNLVIAILAALLVRQATGRGQVVEVSMLAGAAALAGPLHAMVHTGAWVDERASNFEDGAAPYYRCYRTADDRFVAVAALEPPFYRQLLERLDLDEGDWPQHERARWPALQALLESIFLARTRDDWAEAFTGTDACVTPVLSLLEAPHHPQNRALDAFVEDGPTSMPGPPFRFSDTPARLAPPTRDTSADGDAVLVEAGYSPSAVEEMRGRGVIT
jgi:alpha-methylacyl-CoA racemase